VIFLEQTNIFHQNKKTIYIFLMYLIKFIQQRRVKMKKIIFGVVLLQVLVLSGCAQSSDNQGSDGSNESESALVTSDETSEEPQEETEVYEDDRYTKHVKNYVGRNASSVGTLRMSGNFMESYGALDLLVVHITENGEAVTEDNVADYRVVRQEPAPGTPISLEYKKNSEGEEYDNLLESSSIKELILHLEKVSTGNDSSDDD